MNRSIEKWYLLHLITIQKKDDSNLKASHQCRNTGIPFDSKETHNAKIQAALVILPHPINRQCLSIRLLNAIFSPISVQAGCVNAIFARSWSSIQHEKGGIVQ